MSNIHCNRCNRSKFSGDIIGQCNHCGRILGSCCLGESLTRVNPGQDTGVNCAACKAGNFIKRVVR